VILPILAALALQALPAPGDVHWENISTEGLDTVDIDPSSITREGETATALMRVHVGPETAQDGISWLVLRQAMNCRTRQLAIIVGDAYGEDGRLRSSLRPPGPQLSYYDPPPGPDADRLHRRMCGGVET